MIAKQTEVFQVSSSNLVGQSASTLCYIGPTSTGEDDVGDGDGDDASGREPPALPSLAPIAFTNKCTRVDVRDSRPYNNYRLVSSVRCTGVVTHFTMLAPTFKAKAPSGRGT